VTAVPHAARAAEADAQAAGGVRARDADRDRRPDALGVPVRIASRPARSFLVAGIRQPTTAVDVPDIEVGPQLGYLEHLFLHDPAVISAVGGVDAPDCGPPGFRAAVLIGRALSDRSLGYRTSSYRTGPAQHVTTAQRAETTPASQQRARTTFKISHNTLSEPPDQGQTRRPRRRTGLTETETGARGLPLACSAHRRTE
jgi:hypothetical protein